MLCEEQLMKLESSLFTGFHFLLTALIIGLLVRIIWKYLTQTCQLVNLLETFAPNYL